WSNRIGSSREQAGEAGFLVGAMALLSFFRFKNILSALCFWQSACRAMSGGLGGFRVMLNIRDLHLHYGARHILRGVDLTVQDGECIALVGPNGCGKSSFLRVIAGLEHSDGGEVMMPSGQTVGYLPQEANLAVEHSVETELHLAFSDVLDALAEKETIEHRLAEVDPASSEHEELMHRYGDVIHIIEHQDGYHLEVRIRQVAAGLGFSQEDLRHSCGEFSGGWQMRILLAKLLLQNPDVLLLDEPTNHLDLESTLWLENWIRNCRRTVLLVTHERATMDRLADRIVCIEQGKAETYPGNYDKFVQTAEAKREAQWQAYRRQQEEIASMEQFIRRFRAQASKASLVQSRIKALDKIERLEPPFHPSAIHFAFPKAPESYDEVVKMENLGHAFDGNRVFSNANLTIRRGEKVGLVGLNGAGKSTLLKIIAGRIEPTEGSCAIGRRVEMSYFAQYDLSTLSSDRSLLETIRAGAPTKEAGRSRDLLGAFLFSGDDVEKPLSVLSGGERTRFRLAQMLFSPANMLLLDEPTNHLDVTSRSTVEEALRDYTGTVIVVSHDRLFMERVTNRIIEIEDGDVHSFPGSYEAYLHHKELQVAQGEREASEEPGRELNRSGAASGGVSAEQGDADGKERHQNRKKLQRQLRALEREIDGIEKTIESCESRLGEIDAEMAQPEVAGDFDRLDPLARERKSVEEKLEKTMEKWETLHERHEDLQGAL
ncbi:MAG: ABC-F family ATP-binding cassette domain-containing protein, partial [Candidatus Sumerlaeota bacterium]